jgi:hypothetical protein
LTTALPPLSRAAGGLRDAGGGAEAAVARLAAAGARLTRGRAAAGLPAAGFTARGFAAPDFTAPGFTAPGFTAGGFAAPGFAAGFAALAFPAIVATVRRAPGLPRRFAVARGFCGVRARAIATTLPCAARADAARDRAPH